MDFTPLIYRTRGGHTECVHHGVVAVSDYQGRMLAYVGNPYWKTFTRSTLKPLQAIPFIQKGGLKAFGFDTTQTAMLCASHNGEALHIDTLDQMLHQVGLTPKLLQCGCHIPGSYSFFQKAPPEDLTFDQRHHNCSGKHTGFLAYCQQHGQDLHSYLESKHPLQIAIRQVVAQVCRVETDALLMGIDGCSAPNYALPLSQLAHAYARLVSGQQDDVFGDVFEPLVEAMLTCPEIISGSKRNDLAFTKAGRGDWISKIGADGVQVIASKSRRQALAIKIIDSDQQALYATTVEVLEQLGWLDEAQRQSLQVWRKPHLLNANGRQVGERKPVFRLTF
jgi:L-asparaginase II